VILSLPQTVLDVVLEFTVELSLTLSSLALLVQIHTTLFVLDVLLSGWNNGFFSRIPT